LGFALNTLLLDPELRDPRLSSISGFSSEFGEKGGGGKINAREGRNPREN
jgi:hypothetical protein